MNAQTFEHLEELAPLHGIAAALDLAQEILADTNAAGRIILANLLGFTGGADDLAEGCGGVDG
ncbi:hypothetical protein Tharo_2019 [Thauera aromatica K172]|uniref:Uncharacterized protein n=1 Tax=Thauera aromatica K172 TaxID=44139 RepID=A0A2R4BP15_THAAR|nr:hypothetical protein Tharo_2019 [Thauera aromatica K172]